MGKICRKGRYHMKKEENEETKDEAALQQRETEETIARYAISILR